MSNVKRKNEKKELTDEDLKQEEIERARELWIREVQGSVLDDEKFDQVKVSLSLYKDDKGILRCGGRLKNAPIPFNARFPIFLPRSSHFTNLVINEGPTQWCERDSYRAKVLLLGSKGKTSCEDCDRKMFCL